ncbi:alpha/beta fold hydrolase [Streptomyces platensis]|uniref:alpha/beta fold hydrolase n=1 Tax=Streptomyces platensis TaxID=58346 RepID=UPI0039B76BDA
MPHFRTYDDAELHYRVLGPADSPLPPLVCLAGGPGRDAAYLGDLGGLAVHRQLLLPDSRGTGASPAAADPARYAFPHSPRTWRRSGRIWAWSGSRCSRTTRGPRSRRRTRRGIRSG